MSISGSQSQTISVTEAMSPQAFRGTVAFALGSALVGLILAIISTVVPWMAFGAPNQSPEFLYSPFQFQSCRYDFRRNYQCKKSEYTACEYITELQKLSEYPVEGNFCVLDENLKGLVIASTVFAVITVIGIGYILSVGVTATKNAFFVAGGSGMISTLMGISAVGVCNSIKGIPLFSGSKFQAKNEAGFATEVVAFVMFLMAGGVALAQARTAPAAVNPHDAVVSHPVREFDVSGRGFNQGPVEMKPHQQNTNQSGQMA
ncbi:hypothetical protein HDU97_004954 [Phlyctochytrium planicorne]|nr:hypothetical protein HDU97_004954 [Phlyctochytrium planicorne]